VRVGTRLRHRPWPPLLAWPGATRPDLSESRGGLGANDGLLPLCWAGGPCATGSYPGRQLGLLVVVLDRRSALPLWSLQTFGWDLAAGVSFRAIANACGPPAGPTQKKWSASVPHLRPPPGPGPWGRFASRPPLRTATHQTSMSVRLRLGQCRHAATLSEPPPAQANQVEPAAGAAHEQWADSPHWLGLRWATIPFLPAGVPTDGAGPTLRRLGRWAGPGGRRELAPGPWSGLRPDPGRTVHGQSGVLKRPFSAPIYTRQGRVALVSLFSLQQEIK
jgi:hypothetical protein